MCRLEEEWVNKLKSSKKIQDSAFEKLKEALDIQQEEIEEPSEKMSYMSNDMMSDS